MRSVLLTLFLFVCTLGFSQQYTLLQINSEWNSANNVKMPKVKGVKTAFAYLEDQSSSFKQSIKSVPVVILYKDDLPVYQWVAGISMKLEIKEEDVLEVISKQ